MRSIEQIVHDNGGDNTPGLDTHNLTGRVPEHVWVATYGLTDEDGMPLGVEPLFERDLAPLGEGDWSLDDVIDCE